MFRLLSVFLFFALTCNGVHGFAEFCGEDPCTATLDISCTDAVETGVVYDTCCSLSDLENGNCLVIMAEEGVECFILTPRGDCTGVGCLPEENIISADIPGATCRESDYTVTRVCTKSKFHLTEG
jgi:hypothetical protein